MTYNDTTNLNGVIQEFERLTDTGYAYFSGDATRLKEATAMANQDNRRILSIIINSTGNWQYDDSNYTDLPIATTNLVSAQDKYALPATALTIKKIEIKDASGLWVELTPISLEQIGAVDEFLKTDSTPSYYRLVNGTIELFSAPNYASTGGLKVYFDRDVVDFTVSDTTKAPGFASPFHELLPLKMAIRWLTTKQPTSPSLAGYRAEEARIEAEIKRFYATRFKDKQPKIGRKKESYK